MTSPLCARRASVVSQQSQELAAHYYLSTRTNQARHWLCRQLVVLSIPLSLPVSRSQFPHSTSFVPSAIALRQTKTTEGLDVAKPSTQATSNLSTTLSSQIPASGHLSLAVCRPTIQGFQVASFCGSPSTYPTSHHPKWGVSSHGKLHCMTAKLRLGSLLDDYRVPW